MSNVKFELNEAGVRELLKSEEMQAECKKHADRICDTANGMHPGYITEARKYPTRSGYTVRPNTEKAFWDNYHHNTLLKSRGF